MVLQSGAKISDSAGGNKTFLGCSDKAPQCCLKLLSLGCSLLLTLLSAVLSLSHELAGHFRKSNGSSLLGLVICRPAKIICHPSRCLQAAAGACSVVSRSWERLALQELLVVGLLLVLAALSRTERGWIRARGQAGHYAWGAARSAGGASGLPRLVLNCTCSWGFSNAPLLPNPLKAAPKAGGG